MEVGLLGRGQVSGARGIVTLWFIKNTCFIFIQFINCWNFFLVFHFNFLLVVFFFFLFFFFYYITLSFFFK